eukprot:6087054-Alexandrium_andersonii.AAC.1
MGAPSAAPVGSGCDVLRTGRPCRRMASVACWPWLVAAEVAAKACAASAACLSWASRGGGCTRTSS